MSEVTWTPKDGPSREELLRVLSLDEQDSGISNAFNFAVLKDRAALAAHDLYAENQRLERELAEYRRVLFPAP